MDYELCVPKLKFPTFVKYFSASKKARPLHGRIEIRFSSTLPDLVSMARIAPVRRDPAVVTGHQRRVLLPCYID
jgi:hypothetical protein